jgi:cyclopropane-fatty-acyl-phospholipid synthase
MHATWTAPLRRELAAALPTRPFVVELWDGTGVPATESEAPTFALRSPRALAHLVRSPNQLGVGRAYVAGDLEVSDLDAALRVALEYKPSPPTTASRVRLALAAAAACGPQRLPRVPTAELRARGERHSRARDAQVVRHHYEVSNEFFALFLDDSMTYSCGVFSRGAKTLAQAQEAKLELVCAKLGLQEGERVLDVGCGWGSFAIHAASRHDVRVVGITLAPAQAELARRRVEEAGLADRVEIRVADYRDLGSESFDAVSSIGMVEHVGEERLDEYARCLAGVLAPGGRLLNHGIARLNPYYERPGLFSERYVFPDGDPVPLSRVLVALERAGFQTEHVEGFREDYAETLRHWIERLDNRLEEAGRLAGDERVRVWRLYLRAARNGFETGFTSIYQVRATRLEARTS